MAQKVTVIGAGEMGHGIAELLALHGYTVSMRDIKQEYLDRGMERLRWSLDKLVEKAQVTRQQADEALARIHTTLDVAEACRDADFVIEAVFEDVELKKKVFHELDEAAPDKAILASNTSAIPITNMAFATRRPTKVVGMHFFSPVEKMPLLEVIVTAQTAPWALATAVDVGHRMGKTVIVVQDRPGFWVNRILGPYLGEAGRLGQEGVPIERIDWLMKRFGFPVGPVTLLDEIGLDVAAKAAQVLFEAYGDRLRPLDGLERLVSEGRLGRKSGRGFYRYEDGRRRGVDDTVPVLVGGKAPAALPHPDVGHRLVYARLNEAARAMAEGALAQSGADGAVGSVGQEQDGTAGHEAPRWWR